jgi:NhaP-type Na+/H+ or K+/H+ antiporter
MLDLRLRQDAVVFEHLTEAAVLISLFAVGLRLRLRLSDRLWLVPVMLATVAMLLTIAMTLGGAMALGLSLPAALMVAAILAPTDPVLASDVQMRDAADRDRLRLSLTGEGGLNDGIAFPFVVLSLGLMGVHELGAHAWRWWAIDLAWASAAGLALGWGLGFGFSKAVVFLRREKETAFGMESFLTLGLIALTYGASLALEGNGFLAVFAAGLAVRQVEHREHIDRAGHEVTEGSGLDPVLNADSSKPEQAPAYIAKAVLDFALDLEKLAELTVMLMIGSLIGPSVFNPTSIAIALLLIFVFRPLAVYATTWRLHLTRTQRRLVAWFGVRGIGSMFYLAYAVVHGAKGRDMPLVVDAVLATIVISVLLHGSSATPVMALYRRRPHDRVR